MNGEIYQICRIVAAAKSALKTGNKILYDPIKYENNIDFQFLPQKKLFVTTSYKAVGIQQWYEHCLKNKLQDIKFLTPTNVQDRNILGFSNTTQSSIVCFYKNGKVSYFSAKWEFDSIKKVWNILYTEHEFNNAPIGKPHFENNTENFKLILTMIERFACTIECDYFADLFHKALTTLNGSTQYINTEHNIPLPEIPKKNLCIFQATSMADVFGAMGSWNDSPPYMAHEKGLDIEYDALSNELLKQIRLAILYAINEW